MKNDLELCKFKCFILKTALIIILVICMAALLTSCRSYPECRAVEVDTTVTRLHVFYYDDSTEHFIIEKK